MNLDQIQNLMNNLGVYFKVFVDPDEKSAVLRIFHERDDNFTDIVFDMQGHPVIVEEG